VFKHLRTALALGATVTILPGLLACGGGGAKHGIPPGAIVGVQGVPITKASAVHWLAVAAISNSTGILAKGAVAPDPPTYAACVAHLKEVARVGAPGHPPKVSALRNACSVQYATLLKRALDFLITAQWEIGEAQALGLTVSDAELNKEFEKVKKQQFPTQAALDQVIKKTDQTVADLHFRVKLNMINEKIQQHILKAGKVSVSQAQIEKYYNANKAQFASKETRDIRVILTKTAAAARAAKREVESGKEFASVAKRVSIETSSRAKGGLLLGVTKEQNAPELDNAAFAARKGVLGGPIKTILGYYIYEVVATKAVSQQTMAQARPAIKAQLSSVQEQALVKKFGEEFKTRWTARTECLAGYVVPECKEYKAPSGGSAAATPEG
jgi:foldase protein PrsA